MTRDPNTVLGVIQLLDVRNAFAFLPHVRLIDGKPTAPLTLCNAYASVFCACLGVRLPPTLKANQQIPWLHSEEGRLAGWMTVDYETAKQRAISGFPTLVGWVNPTGGPGHIGAVVPPLKGFEAELFVSAAGRTNVARDRIRASFGDVAPLVFSTHD